MLPCFADMKGMQYDCLSFLPSENDSVKVEAGRLVDPGEKLGGSAMGDSYEIVLFKDGEDGVTDIDHFKAILGCPMEYASFIIPGGWYGLITSWTTNSNEITDDLLERLKSYA
jgi:hypothetical protein